MRLLLLEKMSMRISSEVSARASVLSSPVAASVWYVSWSLWMALTRVFSCMMSSGGRMEKAGFMDVTVSENDYVAADKEGVDFFHERYDCHELDQLYESLPAKEREKYAPTFFYFVIDKVVATNLS